MKDVKNLKLKEYIDLWLEDLEPGWKKAFGDNLSNDLIKSITEDECEDSFEFIQIKEKYGSLRLYASGYGDLTKEVLHKYEELSKYICGHCGQNAKWVSTEWIYPFCDNCIQLVHDNPVPIQKFYLFETYDDVLKEIDNIKTNYKYTDYWKPIK